MPNQLGSEHRPLRVAIVGSGPSGFYSAESLFKTGLNVVVNMFDRLPAPYGLVRYGVAPDHGKIKNVIKIYEKIATEHEHFHFFGHVEIGEALTIHQLRKFHDAVIFANGAETDRKLGIEGENLPGSHTATEFVAWYNGHPDMRDLQFDLSGEVAVIIGQGNVAMDVARILCKTIDELKNTDISQHALDVLATSNIKEVHVVGRRGPAQAAFTSAEIKEFGELSDCYPVINDENDLNISYPSQTELADPANAQKKKNFEILKSFIDIDKGNKKRKLVFHFKKSPAAIYPDENGKLDRVYLERNELVGEPGKQRSRGTGEKETLKCSIFFRSVGYRGVPIKGLPFHDAAGIIPNEGGRVMDSEHISTGLYTAGWIKRGPSGIIGTNKPDAEETVKLIVEDLKILNPCKNPDNQLLINLLNELGVKYVTFHEWLKINEAEIEAGLKVGKPREKFTRLSEMLKVIGK